MKLVKLSLVAASVLVSASAFAATPGVYVGAGVGYTHAETGYSNYSYDSYHDSVNNGSALGRVFVGYNAIPYLGVEAGYNYLGRIHQRSYYNSDLVAKGAQTFQSGDLVLKGYMPVKGTPVNLYGLVGGAIVNENDHYVDYVYGESAHSNTTQLLPKYGIGVSYDLPNVPVTAAVEASRIQHINNIPNIDSYTFSLSYNFGNLGC